MKKLLSCAVAATFALLAPSEPVKAGADPYLGDVMIVGFNFCPRGWANANGQLLPINQNQSLYSLLGTQFGGDGRTTFALPDLRGRHTVNDGNGPGLSPVVIGQKSGQETTTQTQGELPAHTHSIVGGFEGKIIASANPPSTNDPTGNFFATFPGGNIYSSAAGTLEEMGAGTVRVSAVATLANTGGQQPETNMQPSLGLTFCVATSGSFPPRN